jgi:hypothetical protein
MRMMMVESVMVQQSAHSFLRYRYGRAVSTERRVLAARTAKTSKVPEAARGAPSASLDYGNLPRRNAMPDLRVSPGEAQEDQITAAIEKYTSQVPSSIYLGLAVASIVGSLALKATKKDHGALYVGQWVAPFLLLGIYNKLVKQHGSDAAVSK